MREGLPARQSPVDADAVSAALLIACRACALSLSMGGLIADEEVTAATEYGTPVVLVRLSPLMTSDGRAIAAATLVVGGSGKRRRHGALRGGSTRSSTGPAWNFSRGIAP